MNPFQHTKYLSFPLTFLLFSIRSTSHSSFPSIMTGAGCSFLCPSTCPTYCCTLLTLTTGYIFTVVGSSNLTAVTLQVNFPRKITFDTLYTNEFVIRVRSRALSIPSECITI